MYAWYQAEQVQWHQSFELLLNHVQDRKEALIRAQAAAVQAEKDAEQAEIAKFARDFLNAIDGTLAAVH